MRMLAKRGHSVGFLYVLLYKLYFVGLIYLLMYFVYLYSVVLCQVIVIDIYLN